MAEKQGPEDSEGSQTQPSPAPKSVNLNVGGNIEKSVVVIGDNNVIHYYSVVENNIEKHEPNFWLLKHPYPMPPNFTGRIAERASLTHWLKEDSENRLCILRALGGFGKSALTWHWLTHDVDIKEYPKVVFWSFYESDASFEHFIEETLKYLKLEVPQGGRPQVDELLKAVQTQKILIIMDGFERALRAYSSMNAAYQGDEPKVEDNQLDCVSINAEIFLKGVCSLPNIKSKVLMTTRLTPRAIKPRGEFMLGCREVELTAMQPADAVEFFHKQKIKGTHAEIEAACALYGYHPLSLRLLAGRIRKDFKKPADIVVASNLKIDGDLIQQKHHVLEVSYNSLPKHEKTLLSTIACFRSLVAYDTLVAITKPVKEEKPKGLFSLFKKKASSIYGENIDSDLQDLVERGLLHFHERNKKFDLHPIVRRYAYMHFTDGERKKTHVQLGTYFIYNMPNTNEPIKNLDDLDPEIEIYHHMVRAGKLDESRAFLRDFSQELYYQFGAYQIIIELLQALFLDSEDKPPRLKEESAQAWTLNSLANAYSLSGQPHHAVLAYTNAIKLWEKAGDKKNLVTGLGNVGDDQLKIGALNEAEHNFRRSIEISRTVGNDMQEAYGKFQLAHVFSYCGIWRNAEHELKIAQTTLEKAKHVQALGTTYSCSALLFLLMAKDNPQSSIKNYKSATKSASRALELADMLEDEDGLHYAVPRDYIRAYWLLGAAYRASSNLTLAEENLSKGIRMCRQINLVQYEANILLDLARLRYDQQNYEEAKSLADEALLITERCEYVLQGADVNLFLAQYALEQEKDKARAKEYAETALKLATCDGPPYYYKVAYEEAERFLENLK